MSLVNVGFTKNGLLGWQSRHFEDQALLPVTDPIELRTTWTDVENRLRSHTSILPPFESVWHKK